MKRENEYSVFALILCSFLMTSCATLLNHNQQSVDFKMHKDISIESINHKTVNANGDNTFLVDRGNSSLVLSLKYDTIKKQIEIKPKNSFAYWSNICFNYGIGMLYENNNPKRYAFPKKTYIDFYKNDFVLRRFPPIEKGTFSIHFALPHINSFNVNTFEKRRNSVGFWGIEAGIDYAYSKNKYISVQMGAVTDFFIPVPAPVNVIGPYQSTTNVYLNARSNYKFKRIDYGFGLAFSKMFWKETNAIDTIYIPYSTDFYTLGFSFSSSYQMSKLFHIGILYQPSFVRFKENFNLCYQHQCSIEFIWKFPFYKKNIKN